MRKLLLLSLLLVGCKPLLFIEVPPDMQLDTSFHAKNPHKVVLFVEHDVYYKQAQTNPDYRAAKERISALLPPASNKWSLWHYRTGRYCKDRREEILGD